MQQLDEIGSPATMAMAMAGRRFFGFVIGGALPAALAASWLTPAWVHVDGAFGLWVWAAAAPSRAYLVEGVEDADSWAADGHKWLSVP